MEEKLLKSFQGFASFSEQEASLIISKTKLRNFRRKETLLKTGETCSAFYFIVEGAIRQYRTTEDLDEITLNLYLDNNWVLEHQSFTSQKPSTTTIQAFEDCTVYELEMQAIHELIGRSPSFFQLGKILEQPLRGIELYQNLPTPEEKYRAILKHNPLLIQKFPLKYIASYLKITPETLSRVRNKLSKPS
ncbi:Crp/Fnr family transcriptional regulator [uncultured Aquimarina sp.]|uniref:Crp/Fnr family transcriptional regulator n=1 Tax=uncultured Aquimarina sp. TaxID=575652 RepID=UPI002610C432|nr:Crp/Fnr family transcriptional regulator [uncultured Aquimarina sp.]